MLWRQTKCCKIDFKLSSLFAPRAQTLKFMTVCGKKFNKAKITKFIAPWSRSIDGWIMMFLIKSLIYLSSLEQYKSIFPKNTQRRKVWERGEDFSALFRHKFRQNNWQRWAITFWVGTFLIQDLFNVQRIIHKLGEKKTFANDAFYSEHISFNFMRKNR